MNLKNWKNVGNVSKIDVAVLRAIFASVFTGTALWQWSILQQNMDNFYGIIILIVCASCAIHFWRKAICSFLTWTRLKQDQRNTYLLKVMKNK